MHFELRVGGGQRGDVGRDDATSTLPRPSTARPRHAAAAAAEPHLQLRHTKSSDAAGGGGGGRRAEPLVSLQRQRVLRVLEAAEVVGGGRRGGRVVGVRQIEVLEARNDDRTART